MGKIFAVSGGQQMGKTTLCHELVRELNLRNQSVGFAQEAVLRSKYMFKESRCIEMHLETLMLHILEEISISSIFEIAICDRSAVDYLAFANLPLLPHKLAIKKA